MARELELMWCALWFGPGGDGLEGTDEESALGDGNEVTASEVIPLAMTVVLELSAEVMLVPSLLSEKTAMLEGRSSLVSESLGGRAAAALRLDQNGWI